MSDSDSKKNTTLYKVYCWLIDHKLVLSFILMMQTWAVIHISITFLKFVFTFNTSYFSMWTVLGLRYIFPVPKDSLVEFFTGFIFVAVTWLIWYLVLRERNVKEVK